MPDTEQPVPTWIRVTDRDTGHQYDVAGAAFRPEAHLKVNAPKQYPDLYGPGARPRRPKHRVTKGGQAPALPASTTTAPDVGDSAGPIENGDPA